MSETTGRAALELSVRGLSEGDKVRVRLSPLTIERGVAHKVATIREIHPHNATIEHDDGLLTNIPADDLYPYERRGFLAGPKATRILASAMRIRAQGCK